MQPAATLIAFMVILFIAGICLLFATYLRDEVLIPVKDKIGSSTAKGAISNIEFMFNAFDEIFLFTAVGFGIVSILLAYLTPAKPAFLFLSILLFAIALLIIPSFANIFQDVSEEEQFSSYTSDYPMMMHIFQNFPLFFWMFGFMIIVVLFAKIRYGEGNV